MVYTFGLYFYRQFLALVRQAFFFFFRIVLIHGVYHRKFSLLALIEHVLKIDS